ncbi:MAG: GSCFA domain-containing protein [Candidatus Cryptobacteroides sp.]|nr:GSCFA domain-containing protein [Candidatus Cryptobacteroides sp.]
MEGLKLQTPVETSRSKVGVSLNDKIVILGSCFADNMGQKMVDLGFDVCLNPFGTLYNPVSVCNSVARLTSGIPFSKDECVQMGAGAGLVCSFSHHTSFARRTEDEFLQVANASLKEASLRWKAASKVIITLGTAWIYEYTRSGETVSNCLKIEAKEFTRRRLYVRDTATLLMNMIARHPEKEFIFTVSPIRHFKDGAHGNQISKSTLLLALDEVLAKFPERCEYFPAYEIVLDELRDYRFYAADMIHPSDQAVDYLWSRFVRFAMPESELPALDARRRELLRAQHRPIHG